MDLEIIILSKSVKDKFQRYHLYAQSKYDTNERICKTKTDSWTQKTNLWLPKETRNGRDKLGI